MKKILFALIAACSLATANAQQHSILLYGNVGLHTTNDGVNTKTLNYNINPGIGYQFTDNWTVGLNLGWGQNTTKDDITDITTSHNTYDLGLFGRYTQHIGGIFSWYGQLNAGYNGGYTTAGSAPTSGKYNGMYANLFPAIGVAVWKSLAFNFSVGGLGYQTMKPSGGVTASAFDLTFGQQVNLGISMNFGCGHHMSHREPGEEMRHMDTSDDDDAPKMHHRHHTKSKKAKVSNDDDE